MNEVRLYKKYNSKNFPLKVTPNPLSIKQLQTIQYQNQERSLKNIKTNLTVQ